MRLAEILSLKLLGVGDSVILSSFLISYVVAGVALYGVSLGGQISKERKMAFVSIRRY
jgi:hypothetical protein